MKVKAVVVQATCLPPKLRVVPVFRSFAGQKLLLFLFCALLVVKLARLSLPMLLRAVPSARRSLSKASQAPARPPGRVQLM